MATLQTISNVLKEIRAAYPNWKADEDTIKVWTVYLKDLDDDLLIASVRKFISSSGHAFPPSIPEIRANSAALLAEINRVPSALDAWDEVLRAKKPRQTFHQCDVSVNSRGWLMVDDPAYQWSHLMVETCARRFGWPNFPSGENDMADRAHFMKAYDLMVSEETKKETRLPQITQYVEHEQISLDKQSALDTGERGEMQRQLLRLSRGMNR